MALFFFPACRPATWQAAECRSGQTCSKAEEPSVYRPSCCPRFGAFGVQPGDADDWERGQLDDFFAHFLLDSRT